MTGVRQYNDTVAISLPAGARPLLDDPTGQAEVTRHLTAMATGALHASYPHTRCHAIVWTFCRTPEEIEAWVPPCDCADCADAKTRGLAIMATDEGAVICLGNLICSEPAPP